MKTIFVFLFAAIFFQLGNTSLADVTVANLFGNHMVIQQNQNIRVWGWADAGEKVTVSLDNSKAETTADAEGNWKVELPARKADNKPLTLSIAGKNKLVFSDVLIGEVWVCSGQSNMGWPVSNSFDADLDSLGANYPRLRLISVPQVGTQEPQKNFDGQWEKSNPESIKSFSAVGFYFGRQLHQILDIPVGLIDNAWGGSACEAWVRRDLLESDSKYTELMERWNETEANYDAEKVKVDFEKKLNRWKEKTQAARKAGTPLPKRPRSPRNPLLGQHRPANLYNGVLKPIIGYPIQGVVWYQGEANAGRAYQYRDLFPLMINHWRDEWKIGDFAFYWVQLADFRDEKPEPTESDWAELREAQTTTMSKLNNTGEAVIIDVGESNNIHPRNKLVVGMRLARWALAKQYGHNIVHRSPIFRSMEVNGNKVVVTFDHVGSGLKNHDFREIRGFALASGDGPFKTASAKIVGKNQVEVWADDIKSPTAVRYAWADNPVCNLISHEGLPVTPFRTDKRPGVTINNRR